MDSKFVVIAFALLTALTLPGLSWGDDSASAAEEEELTPCQKMMAKCRGNWGECFPREAYNGDACCQQGASFKCGDDMTIEEGMTVDPVYAEAITCQLRAHPNLQSYVDCLPDMSECNMCDRKPWEEPDRRDILECPRNVQCILREIPDLDSLRKCFVKYDRARGDEEAEAKCNSPAPEFSAATSKSQIGTGLLFAEGVPFVNVTTDALCKELVDSYCPCKWASCVQRVGYAKTNCCPDQFDLVCCATKAVSMQELIIAEKLASATEPTTTTIGTKTGAASSAVPSLAAALLIGYMFPNIYWAMVL
uniref:Uncharacterized protein n=1 Tax=Globodera rostochiensis TaxID=31243 RepID=A0A914I9X4_GLORO